MNTITTRNTWNGVPCVVFHVTLISQKNLKKHLPTVWLHNSLKARSNSILAPRSVYSITFPYHAVTYNFSSESECGELSLYRNALKCPKNIMKSTKVQTLGELRMRGTAMDGLGYWRLFAVSR